MTAYRSYLDVWGLVVMYGLLYIAVGYLVDAYVLTPSIVEGGWLESMSEIEADRQEAEREKWRLLGYVLTPIWVALKIGFTAVCLAVACALTFWDVRFSNLFRSAAQAESVFVVASVIHLVCLLFIVEVDSLMAFSSFYPLSALNLLDVGADNFWLAYLLKTINVFEVVYVVVLIIGLARITQKPLRQVTVLVVSAYGSGVLLLVSAATFFLMSLT